MADNEVVIDLIRIAGQSMLPYISTAPKPEYMTWTHKPKPRSKPTSRFFRPEELPEEDPRAALKKIGKYLPRFAPARAEEPRLHAIQALVRSSEADEKVANDIYTVYDLMGRTVSSGELLCL
ncbi:hypothetical protein KIPB_013941 [Kipferlia bialata]|uniref:Uncharacterized protein n=1 Tax=Kipferlia bialata TaxID=797122 RepID=A0A9K3DA54_9EUKA|nr:hypothetical protein KIPB_013941 [Kipferlia bialata]|eukprot:g13941.t1